MSWLSLSQTVLRSCCGSLYFDTQRQLPPLLLYAVPREGVAASAHATQAQGLQSGAVAAAASAGDAAMQSGASGPLAQGSGLVEAVGSVDASGSAQYLSPKAAQLAMLVKGMASLARSEEEAARLFDLLVKKQEEAQRQRGPLLAAVLSTLAQGGAAAASPATHPGGIGRGRVRGGLGASARAAAAQQGGGAAAALDARNGLAVAMARQQLDAARFPAGVPADTAAQNARQLSEQVARRTAAGARPFTMLKDHRGGLKDLWLEYDAGRTGKPALRVLEEGGKAWRRAPTGKSWRCRWAEILHLVAHIEARAAGWGLPKLDAAQRIDAEELTVNGTRIGLWTFHQNLKQAAATPEAQAAAAAAKAAKAARRKAARAGRRGAAAAAQAGGSDDSEEQAE